jgi:starch phosphorylase
MSVLVRDEYGQVKLPRRIGRLHEIAGNLWWSWHEDARQAFRSLDYELWRATGHNPVKQLALMSPDKLEAASKDPSFLELYDSVTQQLDADMSGEKTWFFRSFPDRLQDQIAYFSAEFAIHNSLPIYAGGLGVLAGDICKEASDLGLPMLAVGYMYPQGYFHQRVSVEGWQQEVYTQLSFEEAPISRCAWPLGCGPLVAVEIGDKTVYVSVWLVKVGRVNLYLLDTNVEENGPAERTLSARLYTADPEERLRQLIVLGAGGVRALRLLGMNPSVWHANEDHTGFMMLERLREEIENGQPLTAAIDTVRAGTIFTTHTPVLAGHNSFSIGLLDRYYHHFWESLGIDREAFLALGRYPGLEPGRFSMTALAFRLSSQANGVSRLHGMVARRMWHNLWPEAREDDVPIKHVTNGVHLPTWQAPEITGLCYKYLGAEYFERHDSPSFCDCIKDIPDESFWEVRQLLKTRLIRLIQDRAQRRWVEDSVPPQQVPAMGTLLDPYALTIAFSRRFAEYKRPYLILFYLERLKKLITNQLRPVQVVFAGKPHPADLPAKHLLHQVYQVAMDRGFQGRIAFLEDYDMHLSRDLVRGVDVWLNNPRRLQEASGTSGMKAAVNGVINLSVRDGWWDEAYNGDNGWAIGGLKEETPSDEDRADADALYALLENVIVPLFYDRDRAGVPHGWVRLAKESVRTVSPVFSARRMVKEYAEKMYLPAAAANNARAVGGDS